MGEWNCQLKYRSDSEIGEINDSNCLTPENGVIIVPHCGMVAASSVWIC